MSALPRELAGWERELAAFPRELALALGAWMGRLHAAIGPWAAADARDGEPDGLGALARRGSYDRLLASEWLLADEMPDEFLRRAASGEHLFLSRAHVPRRARRHAVALFDAGPSQLGAPRIVHVALLLVLHRRARSADARFSWGVLQQPEAPLSEAVDPSAVRALLTARTSVEPGDGHLEAWRAAIDDADLWLVGGRRAPLDPAAAGTVRIDDPIALDRTAIDVEVRQASRRIAIELALPDDATCTRLIRDPFRTASGAASRHTASVGRMALPFDGRRLVTESARGFASWAIPASKNGSSGAPRTLDLAEGDALLAVGHRGRKIFAVALRETSEGRSYVVRRHPLGGQDVVIDTVDVDGVVAGRELGTAVVNVLSSDATDLTFHDGHRSVVSVNGVARSAPVRVWNDVIGMTPMQRGALMVVVDPTSIETIARVIGRDGTVEVLTRHPGLATSRALFGSHEGMDALVGIALDAATYHVTTVHRRGAPLELTAPAGTRVVGIHHERDRGPALVIVDEDERAISTIGVRGGCTLRASGRITRAFAAHRGGIVAWCTADGWIEVASIPREEIVLRLPTAEAKLE